MIQPKLSTEVLKEGLMKMVRHYVGCLGVKLNGIRVPKIVSWDLQGKLIELTGAFLRF